METCSIGIDDGTGEIPTTTEVETVDGNLDLAIMTYDGSVGITIISVEGTPATWVKETTTGLDTVLGASENHDVGGADTEFGGVI